MSNVPTLRISRSVVVALLALVTVTPSAASAVDGRVVRRGACTGPSDWKLDVRREDGARLRVKLEIEGGRSGQDWHVFLSDNGTNVFSGTRTSGSGGYLEVRVRATDRSGPDAIKAAANNIATGESCTGRASL